MKERLRPSSVNMGTPIHAELHSIVGIPVMLPMSPGFPEYISKQSTKNRCGFMTGWIKQRGMQKLAVKEGCQRYFTMGRLIDADELLKLANTEGAYGYVSAKEIADAPTMDVVEVTYCKNCKYWHKDEGWCDHHSHFVGEDGEACHPWESENWKMFKEDDFCSWGEKISNG